MTLAKRKPPTKAEAAYQDRARALGCVVCRFRRQAQVGATEIHHRNLGDKHGARQLGQHAVVALCGYHHQGLPWFGWGDDEMRAVHGPSFALHARDFRVWTADALPQFEGVGTERWQAYQDSILAELEAGGLL